MKKQLILVGIIVLLLAVRLSGCNEQINISGDTDKVKIVSYTIETHIKKVGETARIVDGFNPNIENAYKYEIHGIIKNIAGEILNQINVTANFYDSDNNYLFSKYDLVKNLTNSKTDDFLILYYSNEKYFEIIDRLEFEISVD